VSAGSYGNRDDERAQLCLTEDDYACVTPGICDVATRHAHGRVVSALEGGYDLPALARSVRAHLDVLLT
jgi:acetoin utilization deacetylase AcuC-like enzyme